MTKFLDIAIEAAKLAGKKTLEFYRKEKTVKYKEDGSPVTLADHASNSIIKKKLAATGFVVVSEENSKLYLDAKCYWLVDPLDGTKDFIAGSNEFTINISLVIQKNLMLGVVYAPALDELYVGQGRDAFCIIRGKKIDISQQGFNANKTMIASRFHNHPDEKKFALVNSIAKQITVGSALKFCRIVMAEADVYLRLAGSYEWDTAAGQAILEAVGGQVLVLGTSQKLKYGKPYRLNPRLISFRSPYKLNNFIFDDNILQ